MDWILIGGIAFDVILAAVLTLDLQQARYVIRYRAVAIHKLYLLFASKRNVIIGVAQKRHAISRFIWNFDIFNLYATCVALSGID